MTVDVEAGLEANVDARRFQQVLVNLVSNAVRYGGSAVLVRVHSERSALVFEVHDDGEGVAKCARSKRLGGAVFRIVLPNRVPMRLTDVPVRLAAVNPV